MIMLTLSGLQAQVGILKNYQAEAAYTMLSNKKF